MAATRPTVVNRTPNATAATALAALAILAGAGCGAPVVKRDLSKVPAGQVGFDDLCGLQTYFDTLAARRAAAPALVESNDIGGHGRNGGRSRFAFETPFQRQVVMRVLDDNWRRLPDGLANAPRIDIQARWSEKAGVRRVVSTEDAGLIVGRETVTLPYHVCLSELLFGESLYARRREVLGLAPAPATTTAEDIAPLVRTLAPSEGRGTPRDAGASDVTGNDATPSDTRANTAGVIRSPPISRPRFDPVATSPSGAAAAAPPGPSAAAW